MSILSRMRAAFRAAARKQDTDYDARIERLEEQLRSLTDARATPPHHPVHIEHLHIDRAVIEHVSYSSSIGNLEVDELSGKLNIGANYFGPIPEKLFEPFTAGKSKTKFKMNGKPLDAANQEAD